MPGVCNYGYVPLSHLWNIVMKRETTTPRFSLFYLYYHLSRSIYLSYTDGVDFAQAPLSVESALSSLRRHVPAW